MLPGTSPRSATDFSVTPPNWPLAADRNLPMVWVYSHDGPSRRRKRGYILMMDQSHVSGWLTSVRRNV
eukprot:5482795-Pyramimonas_sp.AAC.2